MLKLDFINSLLYKKVNPPNIEFSWFTRTVQLSQTH